MSDEDIVTRLQFWYRQDAEHYENAPADEWQHCQTCAFARDLAEAIATIEAARSDGGRDG